MLVMKQAPLVTELSFSTVARSWMAGLMVDMDRSKPPAKASLSGSAVLKSHSRVRQGVEKRDMFCSARRSIWPEISVRVTSQPRAAK